MSLGSLNINVVVDSDQATRGLGRVRNELARTERSATVMDASLNRSVNSITRLNATTAVIGGLTAGVGLMTRGFREYAALSEDARNQADRLSASWSRLMRGIGADLEQSGVIEFLSDILDLLNRLRSDRRVSLMSPAVMLHGLATDRAGTLAALRGERGVDMQAVLEAPGLRRQALEPMAGIRAERMALGGDAAGAARQSYRAQVDAIQRERGEISADDVARREKLAVLAEREALARDRLIAIEDELIGRQIAQEEAARKAARAAEEREAADRRASQEKERQRRFADEDLASSLRSLEIETMRLRGEEQAADIEEERLRFAELRSQIQRDEAASGEARTAALRQLEELERSRIDALSSVAAPAQNFAASAIAAGLGGVAGLVQQVFGGSQSYEQRSVRLLEQIRDNTARRAGAVYQ